MNTVLIIGLVIAAGIAIPAMVRARRIRTLVERGVPGTARIISKRSGGLLPRHFLQYAYRTEGQALHRQRIPVDPTTYTRFEVGDHVDIFYLLERPKVSAIAATVEAARRDH